MKITRKSDGMKAISLWQPWASLIATGAKKMETRSWATNYRGPLAIHAAKTWNSELSGMLSYRRIQGGLAPLVGQQLDVTGKSWPGVKDEHLPRGCVIATCRLVDCIPAEKLTLEQVEVEKHYGDFSAGRFAWILDDVQVLPEPILAKGMQGLWNWTEKPKG
jgi:hypothetical protein